MTDVLIKRGNLDTERHTEKEGDVNMEDQKEQSTSQGMPKIASKLPEAV